jgi:hypothetical protein
MSFLNQSIVEPRMIPLDVIVPCVFLHRVAEMPLSQRDGLAKHSVLIERTNRSAKAFKFGLRAGSFTV